MVGDATHDDELQRSRHPKTAESPRRPSAQPSDPDASTEPPSEDGGELWRPGRNATFSGTLQRSRHPKTAESRP